MLAGKTGVEASKTMWRQDGVTVFIKLKPKGGRGQFFTPVCRPWTASSPDGALTASAGGGRGAGAASPPAAQQ